MKLSPRQPMVETPLMVNLGQKNSCFWSLKPSQKKKNTTKMTIIFRETTRGFTKTDFRYLETT